MMREENYNKQCTMNKQYTMDNKQITNTLKFSSNKIYNLEDRTLQFSKEIIRLCYKLPKNIINIKLIDQLVRSAGSVGANYREACETISKKDCAHRMRIARKEAKETTYWLNLLREPNSGYKQTIDMLIKESEELRNILSSIITKIG